MKTTFSAIIILLFCVFTLQAQNSLPDSPKKSVESYVYTVDRENLRKIYLKKDSLSDKMLGSPITKYTKSKGMPVLKRGNYMIVEAVGNKLSFTDHVVDDLNFDLVPAEKIMLCLYDSLGNIITDAVVRQGAKVIRCDAVSRTYNLKKFKGEQILEIDHKGVFHYIEIEEKNTHYYARRSNSFKKKGIKGLWHRIFNPDEQPVKDKYTGFIVFNKPRYKPNETVKLKGYMAEHDGTPYDKPVDLHLYNYYPNRIDTLLVKGLMPYRPGMYEYEFKLTNKLGIKLDTHYMVGMKTGQKKVNEVNGRFKYEDYELKSLQFTMRTDKEEYNKDDSIHIHLKATDENNMAMYGGRAEVLVKLLRIDKQKKNEVIFIPDTLWMHEVDMGDVSEKTITIPDSIFPSGASLHCIVNTTYYSADNEKKTETKSFLRDPNDYLLDFALDKGMLTIRQLYKGKSQESSAEISVEGEATEGEKFKPISLPHTMAVPWYATEITVRTKETKKRYELGNAEKGNRLGYRFYRQNDSVFLHVDNPSRIPFWYTLYKGNKEIMSGYTATPLDYAVADKKQEGYNMQLSYLYAGSSKKLEQMLPYSQKNMTLDVSTPTTVYPGQKVDVQISVTDKKGNPVKDADITAYSFTSKFNAHSMPAIPVRGETRSGRSFKDKRYDLDEAGMASRKTDMTWEKWKTTMALDTIAYYKFLYPSTYYKYTSPTVDGSTQLIPYVVVDGALQGIYMLWIDDRLYYTSLAQQMDVYAFQVKPGKHNLRFRTYDREVSVDNFFVEEGARNIVSFNAGQAYVKLDNEETDAPSVLSSKLLDKKKQGILSDKEVDNLSSNLIMIDNNFGKLKLSGAYRLINLPAYIQSGNTVYYLNPTERKHYNQTLRAYSYSSLLVGPFPSRYFMNGRPNVASVYAGDKLISNIGIEGGNSYTLYEDYQKLKNWEKQPFDRKLSPYTPEADFKQEVLTPRIVEELFKKTLKDHLFTLNGNIMDMEAENAIPAVGRLILSLKKDKEGKDIKPVFILFTSGETPETSTYKLFYGGTRHFNNLPVGDARILLAFNDSVSYTQDFVLSPNGVNYLQIDSITYQKQDKQTIDIFSHFRECGIENIYTQNPYKKDGLAKDSIVEAVSADVGYNADNARKGIITGTVLAPDGGVLIGVNIFLEGSPTIGTISDVNGRFKLTGKPGDKFRLSFVGYNTKVIKYSKGADYRIVLEENSDILDEVVVVAYGAQKKATITGAITEAIPGIIQTRATGVAAENFFIRGISTDSQNSSPLIIVNGLPFNGSLEDIDPDSIVSFNVLKDASATAVYGTKAAGGVIMIQTKDMSALQANAADADDGQPAGNSLRRNFHDDAFWQPRLKTDEKGEASFEVTYPDDITRWDAYFIAVGNKKQLDKKEMSINSFKALTARLSMPRFAIRGDSLNAVGRIANHMGDSIQLTRIIKQNNRMKEEQVDMASSHVDYIPAETLKGDSLSITYSLKMTNGYFDGEERSIPILEPGMLQTHGEFRILNDTGSYTFDMNPALGAVTIRAEASSLETFLREINKVDRYPYLCNEQMASKIKALLAKKYLTKVFRKQFREDRKINELIGRLNKNKNRDGLWGWWNNGETEFWISKQVVSALLDAGEAGYKTGLNASYLSQSIEHELKNALHDLESADKDRLHVAKQELLDRLVQLKRLDAQVDYHAYLREIDSRLENKTITDRLKTMYAMSVVGLQDEINVDFLMFYAKTTMLGSMYWGDDIAKNDLYRTFILPHDNNVENTLIAYDILKNKKGYEEELVKIRNYFFECRSRTGGAWQNTYEASRIIETIMPDMLKKDETVNDVSLFVNEKKVTRFPYTETLAHTPTVQVRKEGTYPLFVAAYQQAWNKEPDAESRKGFTVRSCFVANKDTISSLKAGERVQLEVLVNVDADADYVQIEVPIPAGCTYETKGRGYYRNEVHREHFKEKVVIFSNKLKQGEHTFSIVLTPRYTGTYHLNPAKAELMYFPTFYGNEESKTVPIGEKGENR